MSKDYQCPDCGNKEVIFDKVDLMGDSKEEHFGKTAVICSNNKCCLIIEYID